ncbi:carboxypeptidase-like regulatory domain-containing protein [Halalkalicoccus ordinarius]|uniref:carboxypeptidase-like regulatory domain-containing protein n=1 Tax=Halalkalicoccus ordinarius TaxID=3116651 RepID=UPI00300EB92C
MVTRERLLAITLTLIMVTAAGCAGWGTDSPADDQDQGNGDELEDADGEGQADGGNGSDGSSGGATASDGDGSRDSSSSDTGTDSGDTEANTDTTDEGSDAASGGEDESANETGSTEDGDSDSSTDTDGDSDSGDSDSGTGDGDTDQGNEYEDTVEETERTLKVTVVDEDGDPIEGASVHATGPVLSNGVAHEPAGETNVDGIATLTAYDGEYGVEAQHDGTTTDEKTVIVDGDTEATITIDTSPDEDSGKETHPLTVTVLNPDGDPVEGLSVDLTTYNEGEPVATATTDENGQVTFEVEPGDYELVPDVSDSEYTDNGTHPVAVTEDTEYTMKLVSPPGDDGGDGDAGDDDAPYGTLTATVEDSDGETVEGVEVIGIGPEGEIHSATTDANGQATFDLSDGKYTYYVSTDGTEYADSSEEEITMDGSDQSITLTVQADNDDETNTLTVNLANDDVDGVEIEVWRAVSGDGDSNRVTKESENGQATFEREPGHYYADAEGYVGTLAPVDVTKDIEITLQNESGATVPVKVTDAETGDPIAGAEIGGICHLNYSTGEVPITGTTDEDGVAQAHADVTPAWCTGVRISADGYEDAHADINVPTEETVTVELTPEQDGGEEQYRLGVNALGHENTGSKGITVVVQDEETTMTVAIERGATLEKESNIVEVTAMTAVARDSRTSLAAVVT